MMTDHQERLVSLLLGTFPNFQSGDAEAALTAYALVITGADPRDVEPGIMMLINGQLPGFDGRFAPTSAQLARAIRISLERRVDRENAERRALPSPVDDFVQDPPEVRARNKARLDALREKLASDADMNGDKNILKDLQRRTNERFDPVTYTAGDDDGEADMGQLGAA